MSIPSINGKDLFVVRPEQIWKSWSKLHQQRTHIPTAFSFAVALLFSRPAVASSGVLPSETGAYIHFNCNCIESALRMMALAKYFKSEQLTTTFVVTAVSLSAGRLRDFSLGLLSVSFYTVSVWGWARQVIQHLVVDAGCCLKIWG